MKSAIIGFTSLLILASATGCQSVKVNNQEPRPGQPSFMEAWRVYNHCINNRDLESRMVDMLLLKQETKRMEQEELMGLFKPMLSLISPSPVRLAADPGAMAATCTLRTADAALANGWTDLAITLYQSVLPDYHESEYVYYRQQAEAGLAEALMKRASSDQPTATVSPSSLITHP